MTDIYGNYSSQGQSGFTLPPPKAGKGSLVMTMIGAVMAIVGPFMLYYVSYYDIWADRYESEWLSITGASSEDFYLWFSVLGGIMAIFMALMAYNRRRQGLARAAGYFGLLAMAMPLLFILLHLSDFDNPIEGIIYSDGEYSRIFIGGIMIFIGGIIATKGGFGLAKHIKAACDTQNAGWLRPQPTPQQESRESFNEPPRPKPMPTAIGGGTICKTCGCTVQPGWKACVSCGRKMSTNCNNCGNDVKPGWKICPNCGKPL